MQLSAQSEGTPHARIKAVTATRSVCALMGSPLSSTNTLSALRAAGRDANSRTALTGQISWNLHASNTLHWKPPFSSFGLNKHRRRLCTGFNFDGRKLSASASLHGPVTIVKRAVRANLSSLQGGLCRNLLSSSAASNVTGGLGSAGFDFIAPRTKRCTMSALNGAGSLRCSTAAASKAARAFAVVRPVRVLSKTARRYCRTCSAVGYVVSMPLSWPNLSQSRW